MAFKIFRKNCCGLDVHDIMVPIPAAEKASAGQPRHLCRRDSGAGAEGGREARFLGVPE